MKLNLGAADRHIKGFLCVDKLPPRCEPCDEPNGQIARMAFLDRLPWPWPDSSVDEIVAFDVVEHLPSRVDTLNELWRVLIPGGRVTIEVPNAAKGVGFICDPTHVSPYCLSTFKYFELGAFARERNNGEFAAAYGIKARFKIIELSEIGPLPGEIGARETVWKIRCVLEAVKP